MGPIRTKILNFFRQKNKICPNQTVSFAYDLHRIWILKKKMPTILNFFIFVYDWRWHRWSAVKSVEKSVAFFLGVAVAGGGGSQVDICVPSAAERCLPSRLKFWARDFKVHRFSWASFILYLLDCEGKFSGARGSFDGALWAARALGGHFRIIFGRPTAQKFLLCGPSLSSYFGTKTWRICR